MSTDHAAHQEAGSSAATTEKTTVLICGSSIAGTVFALQLLTHPVLRSKYRPILFDSATSLPSLENQAATESSHPEGQSGAAVALSRQAMQPLRDLNLGPELDEISQNTEQLIMYRQPFFGPQDGSQTGMPIIDWKVPSGEGVMGGLWAIQRGNLQGLLIKNILMRGGEIIPNKRLVSIIEHDQQDDEGSIEAVFADDTSYRGDLLVGADGAWSTVRKHLFTQSTPSGETIVDESWMPDFQNLHIMHGICRAETTDTKPTMYAMGLTGVGTGTWTLTENRQMWTIYEAPCGPPPNDPDSKTRSQEASKALSEKWKMDVHTGGYDQASTEAFLQRYRNVWHPSAGTFGNLFDASEKIVRVGLWQKLFTRLGNVRWEAGEKRPKECGRDTGVEDGKGNIVLVGDAARVLMPTAGQGAGFAIEDATVLADSLLNNPPSPSPSSLDFSTAIKHHTRQRLPRYKKISVIADYGARIAVGRNCVSRFLRDYATAWAREPKVGSGEKGKGKRGWWENMFGDGWLLDERFEVKLRERGEGT